LAKANAVRLGLADRSAFIAADWTNSIDARFDLIISNPPYIRAADIATLMPEVALYEPRQALDGGADGYDAYRAIVSLLPHLLEPDAVAILELGQGQAIYVTEFARNVGLQTLVRFDLAQTPRAIVLTAPTRKKSVWHGSGTRIR
jgi:release factor glutamine methyltransferase